MVPILSSAETSGSALDCSDSEEEKSLLSLALNQLSRQLLCSLKSRNLSANLYDAQGWVFAFGFILLALTVLKSGTRFGMMWELCVCVRVRITKE